MKVGPTGSDLAETIGPDARSAIARGGLLTWHRALARAEVAMQQVKKKLPPRPFFTRFLDRQDLKRVDGGSDSTDKFPSDKEDHADFPEG